MDTKKREMDRKAEVDRMGADARMASGQGGGGGKVGNVNAENDQKHLIQQAFSNLSLKDKLAINMIVKKQQQGGGAGGGRGGGGRGAGGRGGRGGRGGGLGGKVPKHQKMAAKVMGNTASYIEGSIMERDDEDDDGGSSSQASSQRREDELEVKSLREENLEYLSDGDDNSVNSVDVSSVFSESDRESLDIAMSLMNDSDLQTLQDDSARIQGNVKAWMLRRNYQTLREATVHLKNR